MNTIEFNGVWKKFKKGERLYSLRDWIPSAFKKIFSINGNGKDNLKEREFWALQNVNFHVKKGEVLGIIGPNGAGKSTILKLLSKILVPNKGEIKINGRLSALIEITAGFHHEFTGRENIYFNGSILGMTKKEIDEKFDSIVEFSGVEEFIDTPVKRYSSGMMARLGFSIAAHVDPDILLVDEVLSVGDAAFRAKCAQKMRELLDLDVTIVLVSHNLSLIQSLCKRVILLEGGKVKEEGVPEEVIPHYQEAVSKKRRQEFEKKVKSQGYKIDIREESPFKISDVSLFDGENNRKEDFRIGEPLSIRVDYEAKEEIESPAFSLDVVRSDGVVCCSSNTKSDNFLTGSIKGKGTLNIELGKLNLVPGVYLVKVSVWDRDMLHAYVIRKRDFFKIAANESKGYEKGVFLPVAKWLIRQYEYKNANI
ncbi:MAG: ABC transporter ATP-binding protein [Candidatus Omnitrophica bacterium]|nr:ABC transporter ATP-binding protein [Candidatus Omnitrophota bacterium]